MQITPKLFASLTVVAVISLVAAGVTYAVNNEWTAGKVAGEALFPQLSEVANEVAALELTQGEKTLTIARQNEGWVAREKDAYPVRADRVRSVIVRLTQAELIEPKTRKPDLYHVLALNDPTAKDAEGYRLRLLDGEGEVLAEAILGRKREDAFGSGRAGMYVRKPDERQTWLANLDIKAKPEIKGWTDSIFFKIEESGIASLKLEHPGEPPLEFTRASGENAKFRLSTAPPDGGKLKEDSPRADTTVTGFAEIQLEDVRKLENPPGEDKASIARLKMEKGPEVTFRLREEGDKHWLSLHAEGDGDAEKKAAKINGRVEGWEYQIPSWKADILFKRRSDFFETS